MESPGWEGLLDNVFPSPMPGWADKRAQPTKSKEGHPRPLPWGLHPKPASSVFKYIILEKINPLKSFPKRTVYPGSISARVWLGKQVAPVFQEGTCYRKLSARNPS